MASGKTEKTLPEDIPRGELRKQLGMVPEGMVFKILKSNTLYQLSTKFEN